MEQKTLPCPFCQRPLRIPLTQNGKIGCRQCRNVSSYDAATGTLTPLIAQNVRPKQPKPHHSGQRHWAIISLLITALVVMGILLILQPWDHLPGQSHSTIDEVKDLLKSLSE